MSLIAIRYTNEHRPEPARETVVVRCKNVDYCAPPKLRIMGVHFDTGHLSHDIVSQIDLIALSNGRTVIQIPIDRRLI